MLQDLYRTTQFSLGDLFFLQPPASSSTAGYLQSFLTLPNLAELRKKQRWGMHDFAPSCKTSPLLCAHAKSQRDARCCAKAQQASWMQGWDALQL